jgi:hypothetical protein
LARALYHGLRLLLAGVFLWSGISKALAPGEFAAIIEAYGLLPEALATPTALLLILLELVAAGGLLFEKRGALALISLLMLLFLLVLGYAIALGLDIDCGCFGPGDPEAAAFHGLREAFQRDLWLLLVIGYLYCWRFINRPTLTPWFSGRQGSTPTQGG